MSIRVGINGFGRMGRLALRTAWDWPEIEIVHINEVKGGTKAAAHLLEFDSIHGRWTREIRVFDNSIDIDGRSISFSEEKNPGDVPWRTLEVDVVIESSGKFRTTELLRPYFDQGIKKVIVAAPVKEGALNIVMGVNDDLYDSDKHHLLTAEVGELYPGFRSYDL
jgi:glyceraldehyde 3-phosphate dehydrogenase